MAKAPALSPLEASDREDEITDWLDDHDVANGWDLAAAFAQAGLDTAWLDQVAATMADSSGGPASWTARCAGSATRSRPSC